MVLEPRFLHDLRCSRVLVIAQVINSRIDISLLLDHTRAVSFCGNDTCLSIDVALAIYTNCGFARNSLSRPNKYGTAFIVEVEGITYFVILRRQSRFGRQTQLGNGIFIHHTNEVKDCDSNNADA